MYAQLPNEKGYFGEFGGSFVPPQLEVVMTEITDQYLILKDDPDFKKQLCMLNRDYTGRPSPSIYSQSYVEELKSILNGKILIIRELIRSIIAREKHYWQNLWERKK